MRRGDVTKFIARAALFLSIPVSLTAAWTLTVVWIDRRSYEAALALPDGCDVAVCSDSQTSFGLDPKFMPRLYNFSAPAAQPDQNLLRLQDLMDRNGGMLKYVLLDVTPVHVQFDEREHPLSDAGSARVHALLHLYHWRDTLRPFGSVALLFRDVVLDRKFNELRKALKKRRPYASSLAGGFCGVKAAGFIEQEQDAKEDLEEKAARINGRERWSGESRIADIMRESVKHIRAAGAEPVFITSPFSPPLLAKLDREKMNALTNGIAALATECDARYLNYLDFNIPLEGWRDANHLNITGAELFTRQVSKDMERIAANPAAGKPKATSQAD